MVTSTILEPLVSNDTQEFDVYIAFSSDTLCILKKKEGYYDMVQWIIVGTDMDCNVIASHDQDVFLETITVIKNMINDGINPLKYIIFD